MCSLPLNSLRNKLSQEPALLNEYNIIKEQEKDGIIGRAEELCGKEEINGGIHFSPYHAVVCKDRETTKVRIIYEGSVKSSKEGRSLNDCLEKRSNLIPHIFDMLPKFRWNSVGLTADIEKAFLNVCSALNENLDDSKSSEKIEDSTRSKNCLEELLYKTCLSICDAKKF